ncbi:MAG: PilZ domain-containing protein [Desulfobacteraceae bacterium]|nr:MAG: PilZ domain-containing protein [Desulfobacteraceae bacterium]
MDEQSIEFQSLEDPLSPKIIRKSFRIPIEDSDDMKLSAKKRVFGIADLSLDGISVFVEGEPEFTIDEKLENCELNLRGAVIKGLQGHVIHYSQRTGEKGKYGIKWENLGKDLVEQIETIFLDVKKEYLLKSHSEPETED